MSQEDLEKCKRYAAKSIVQDMLFNGQMVIGIGSGSTVVYVAKYIAETINELKKAGASDLRVICIPSSFQAKQLIVENNLELGSLDTYPEVDWTIDGADEFDKNNNIIKGGGACLAQEKILASCSRSFYIAADYTKFSEYLGKIWKKGVPIEVLPLSHVPVRKKIENSYGGKALLRLAVKKAGPVVTDNGNFILDWVFPENIKNWKNIEIGIRMIPGVVEVGLFLNMAKKAYIGKLNGEVEKIEFH